MKTASSEISITIISIIAIGLILAFLTGWLPDLFERIKGDVEDQSVYRIQYVIEENV